MSKPDPDNIWKFIKIPEDPDRCWIWIGFKNKKGYGGMKFDGKHFRSHRFVYEYLVGEIAEGITLNHNCENKNCVNPDHMTPMTQKENNNFSEHPNSKKEFCKRGHPFDEKNTHYNKDGRRNCRICLKLQKRAQREKQMLMVHNG